MKIEIITYELCNFIKTLLFERTHDREADSMRFRWSILKGWLNLKLFNIVVGVCGLEDS